MEGKSTSGWVLPAVVTKSGRWCGLVPETIGAFLVLWIEADPAGEGRDTAEPAYWSRRFNTTPDHAARLLDDLEAAGMIRRYEADGDQLLLVVDHFRRGRDLYARGRVPVPSLEVLRDPILAHYARCLASINWQNRLGYTGEPPAEGRDGKPDKRTRPRHAFLWRPVKEKGAIVRLDPVIAQSLRTPEDSLGLSRSVEDHATDMEMETDTSYGRKSVDSYAGPGPAGAAGPGAEPLNNPEVQRSSYAQSNEGDRLAFVSPDGPRNPKVDPLGILSPEGAAEGDNGRDSSRGSAQSAAPHPEAFERRPDPASDRARIEAKARLAAEKIVQGIKPGFQAKGGNEWGHPIGANPELAAEVEAFRAVLVADEVSASGVWRVLGLPKAGKAGADDCRLILAFRDAYLAHPERERRLAARKPAEPEASPAPVPPAVLRKLAGKVGALMDPAAATWTRPIACGPELRDQLDAALAYLRAIRLSPPAVRDAAAGSFGRTDQIRDGHAAKIVALVEAIRNDPACRDAIARTSGGNVQAAVN